MRSAPEFWRRHPQRRPHDLGMLEKLRRNRIGRAGHTIECLGTGNKLRLSAVAGMSYLLGIYAHVIQCKLRIATDRHDQLRTKRIEEPHQQRPAFLPLFASVTPIRHWIATPVRMK